MIQVFGGVFVRFQAWLAADPEHLETWLAVGLALAIAAIAMLTIEQVKARTAEQN
jgi:hypothetical protein